MQIEKKNTKEIILNIPLVFIELECDGNDANYKNEWSEIEFKDVIIRYSINVNAKFKTLRETYTNPIEHNELYRDIEIEIKEIYKSEDLILFELRDLKLIESEILKNIVLR